jgi:hypothetical protein
LTLDSDSFLRVISGLLGFLGFLDFMGFISRISADWQFCLSLRLSL